MRRFLDLIVSPSEEIYRMSRSQLGMEGIGIVILAVYSCTIAMGLIVGIPSRFISFMLTWAALARIVVCLLLIMISSALYHYFAVIQGGRGSAVLTFRGLLYTLSPICLLVPAALIGRAWAGSMFFYLFFILSLFYMAFLQYKLISYFYGLPPDRAIRVLVLPWLIIIISSLLVVFFLIGGLVSALL